MIVIIDHTTETPVGFCKCLGHLYGAGFTGDNRPISLCCECGTLYVPDQFSISPVKD